jgi:hypothetical protein
MSKAFADSFPYRIRPCERGWVWELRDPSGRRRAGGEAPDRAVAAACVIRALTRQGRSGG